MNCIQIGGVRIELTEEQVTELRKGFEGEALKLLDVGAGDTFNLGGFDFIVLEQTDSGTAVILKDLWRDDEVFSRSNNNFDGSNADELCYEFEEELKKELGQDIFVSHSVDLTSDDGLKDYGVVERNVSLLTTEQYRKYVEILDKHKLDEYWWLATPHSTKTHDNDNWVKCVSPSGIIDFSSYIGINIGVRPFCILKSNIFVSCKGE